MLKRKITHYSLRQRESAVCRGHEWLSQRGRRCQSEMSPHSLALDHPGAFASARRVGCVWRPITHLYLKNISTNGYLWLPGARKIALSKCLKRSCSDITGFLLLGMQKRRGAGFGGRKWWWEWWREQSMFGALSCPWCYRDNGGHFGINYSPEK